MRIKNSKAIISFVFCLFASSAAVSEIKLYKGVSLGDEWNKIVETVGYYDCSESGLKIACLDNQKFLGAIGDLGVFFDTEAAVKVMFVSEDLSLYQKAMKFFPSKGFALVAIETNNGANDFIAMNKQNGPEKAVAKLIEIEQFGLSNGFVSYTFLEGDQKSILNYGNIAQAYAGLPWLRRCIPRSGWGTLALSACRALRHVGALAWRPAWPRTHSWALSDLTNRSARSRTFGLWTSHEFWFGCGSLRRTSVHWRFRLRTRWRSGRPGAAGFATRTLHR